MSRTDMESMKQLDEVAEKAGGFVSMLKSDEIRYDYRKILAHCKEKGIEPMDLTIRELNQFIVQ
ncbi:MAG: hypothetical protein IJE10_05400 [Clostridia bacterium]|nr:hypothetical protein [Clostridia bacterium]